MSQTQVERLFIKDKTSLQAQAWRRTSEVAYNMSMQDEVNSMVDGLADPESQVVMNNANVNKDGGDQQIEYTAIAVRGNPLKDGTYISPYAV